MKRWTPSFTMFFLGLAAILLPGCVTTQVGTQSRGTSAICKAVIGPIKYNSTNPKSRRHAGPDLAPDLKQRNQVGQQLGCPAYR